jgi:S-ribosylhomocysteine lyase
MTIKSFEFDHTKIDPGFYLSRIDGDIFTYDLRTRKPNSGDYIDNETMHTFEHMFATFVRSGKYAENVIYFGPMGCQTGYYLLFRNIAFDCAESETVDTLKKIIAHNGDVFGNSEKECGNFRTLDLQKSKNEAELYLQILEKAKVKNA